MKSNHKIHLTCISTLLAVVMILAGCATRGYEKGDAASATLMSAAGEVQAEARQLELTVNALNDLVNKPPADLRLQYEGFSANLDQLTKTAGRNEAAIRRVGQTSAAYFQSWDKDLATMNFEAVRVRSQERKTEVTTNFDALYNSYRETQTTVQPLLDYFYDIRKALGADLTPAGLDAMKSTVSNVNTNAAKVQTALSKLADDLAGLSSKMSSVTAQNAATK